MDEKEGAEEKRVHWGERDNGSAQMLQNKSSVYIVDVYII